MTRHCADWPISGCGAVALSGLATEHSSRLVAMMIELWFRTCSLSRCPLQICKQDCGWDRDENGQAHHKNGSRRSQSGAHAPGA